MKNRIVEAIEKQIPLKPIYKKAFNNSMTMPHCAECHKILEGIIYYCPRCGQKIDWEQVIIMIKNKRRILTVILILLLTLLAAITIVTICTKIIAPVTTVGIIATTIGMIAAVIIVEKMIVIEALKIEEKLNDRAANKK